MNAIGYVRQSEGRSNETIDTSLSLDSQELRIRQYAEGRGWNVVAVIRDHARQGNDPDRPGLQELLDSVTNGTVVIIYDLSRLARSLVLQEITYEEIQRKGGTLVSITEPHANDDLMRGIAGVFNQKFRKDLGRRISAARETSARKGRMAARPPVGYTRVDGNLAIVPEEAEDIKHIFREIAKGQPAYRVAQWAMEHATKKITYNHIRIRDIINNPVYAGGTRYKGEIIWPDEGQTFHEAIVSRELQERAIKAFNERRVNRTKNDNQSEMPFNDISYHECGSRCYARQAANGPYVTYYCRTLTPLSNLTPCGMKPDRLSGSKMNYYAYSCLTADLENVPGTVDAWLAAAEKNYEITMPMAEIERTRLENRINELIAEEARTIEIHQRGFRPIDWMESEIKRIREDQARLEAQLAEHQHAPSHETAEMLHRLVSGREKRILSLSGAADIIREIGRIIWGPSGIRIEYNQEFRDFFPNPTVMTINTERNFRPKILTE